MSSSMKYHKRSTKSSKFNDSLIPQTNVKTGIASVLPDDMLNEKDTKVPFRNFFYNDLQHPGQ